MNRLGLAVIAVGLLVFAGASLFPASIACSKYGVCDPDYIPVPLPGAHVSVTLDTACHLASCYSLPSSSPSSFGGTSDANAAVPLSRPAIAGGQGQGYYPCDGTNAILVPTLGGPWFDVTATNGSLTYTGQFSTGYTAVCPQGTVGPGIAMPPAVAVQLSPAIKTGYLSYEQLYVTLTFTSSGQASTTTSTASATTTTSTSSHPANQIGQVSGVGIVAFGAFIALRKRGR